MQYARKCYALNVFKSLLSGNLESCLFFVLVLEHRVDRENPDEAVTTAKPLNVKAILFQIHSQHCLKLFYRGSENMSLHW